MLCGAPRAGRKEKFSLNMQYTLKCFNASFSISFRFKQAAKNCSEKFIFINASKVKTFHNRRTRLSGDPLFYVFCKNLVFIYPQFFKALRHGLIGIVQLAVTWSCIFEVTEIIVPSKILLHSNLFTILSFWGEIIC